MVNELVEVERNLENIKRLKKIIESLQEVAFLTLLGIAK